MGLEGLCLGLHCESAGSQWGQTFKGESEQFVFVLQYKVSDSLGYEQFNVCIALMRERKRKGHVPRGSNFSKPEKKLPVLFIPTGSAYLLDILLPYTNPQVQHLQWYSIKKEKNSHYLTIKYYFTLTDEQFLSA